MPTLLHIVPPPKGLTPSDPSACEPVDDELFALPAPPKRERTLTVVFLLGTALVALWMVFALRSEVAYAMSRAPVEPLGDLATASAASLEGVALGSLVEAHATLGAAHAIRYERPLREGSFRLMPVAGQANVWVELHIPPGQETARYVPPRTFIGRWTRFDAGSPEQRGLADAIHDVTGRAVPATAWVLVDGDVPAGSRWAIVLAALFSGFAVWNLIAAARLLKRVR